MKTLRNILITAAGLAALLGATASAAPAESCAAGYGARGLFVDGATRTTYFRDVVTEVTPTDDGGAVIAFRKSARRYRVAPSQKDFLRAARASMTNGAEIHAAIAEPAEPADPTPNDVGPMPAVRWLDLSRQHASCRG